MPVFNVRVEAKVKAKDIEEAMFNFAMHILEMSRNINHEKYALLPKSTVEVWPDS